MGRLIRIKKIKVEKTPPKPADKDWGRKREVLPVIKPPSVSPNKNKTPVLSGTELNKLIITHAELGNEEEVRRLLKAGAWYNANKQGTTALTAASKNGHTEVVKLLVQAKADVTILDDVGWTAFRWAVWEEKLDTAEILLSAGANIDLRDKQGRTALIEAAWHGMVGTVLFLLEHDADANIQDIANRTALMGATDNPVIVQHLLEYNAKVNVKNKDGETALDWAKSGKQKDVVKLLKENGAKPGWRVWKEG